MVPLTSVQPCTRKLAWLDLATCMVPLSNLHGLTFGVYGMELPVCMDGSLQALKGFYLSHTGIIGGFHWWIGGFPSSIPAVAALLVSLYSRAPLVRRLCRVWAALWMDVENLNHEPLATQFSIKSPCTRVKCSSLFVTRIEPCAFADAALVYRWPLFAILAFQDHHGLLRMHRLRLPSMAQSRSVPPTSQ